MVSRGHRPAVPSLGDRLGAGQYTLRHAHVGRGQRRGGRPHVDYRAWRRAEDAGAQQQSPATAGASGDDAPRADDEQTTRQPAQAEAEAQTEAEAQAEAKQIAESYARAQAGDGAAPHATDASPRSSSVGSPRGQLRPLKVTSRRASELVISLPPTEPEPASLAVPLGEAEALASPPAC